MILKSAKAAPSSRSGARSATLSNDYLFNDLSEDLFSSRIASVGHDFEDIIEGTV